MANLDMVLLIRAIVNEEETLEHNAKKRSLRRESDILNIPEGLFKKMYRMSRNTTMHLIEIISPFLPDMWEQLAVSKEMLILCALHFYAQGDYQKGVGQDLNCSMSQAAVSRAIGLVTDVLIEHFSYKIKFPITQEDKNVEKMKFMNLPNGFTGIIGCIDCTHVRIVAPPAEHEDHPGLLFYNRKGFYSINTQIICTADLKILGINARYPGSVHDSAIWSTSEIRNHLTQNYQNGDRSSWLLGDSGYPLEPWLIVPVRGQNLNEHEIAFNNSFKSVRLTIEKLNGVLKARFRCLLGHRAMHLGPEKAAKVIYACAILHNIYLERGDIFENDNDDQNDNDAAVNINENILNNNNWLNEGTIIR